MAKRKRKRAARTKRGRSRTSTHGATGASGSTSQTPPPETWLDLEKLAAQIYRELQPKCVVTHDARLRGELSGELRQIDVLVDCADQGTRLVVDCKDWKKRVDVRDIGTFASLVEDVAATSGVMICNRGFSKGAMNLARVKGVKLCHLHDVASRKWQVDVRIPYLRIVILVKPSSHLAYSVRARPGDVFSSPPRFVRDGQPYDPLKDFVMSWNTREIGADDPGEYEWTVNVDGVLTVAGALRPATPVRLPYSVHQEAYLGYVAPQGSRGIVDAETGEYETATLDALGTIAHEPGEGWKPVPDPEELAIRIPGPAVMTRFKHDIAGEWGGSAWARVSPFQIR
jgi:hypothetical protein